MNNIFLSNIVKSLHSGNLDIVYQNKQYLNDLAMSIYNTLLLDQELIEELEAILNICNITYNDTDRELLPIEDGFYDLLLEKYKLYNPSFQVGAESITFDTAQSSLKQNIKKPVMAVTFEDVDANRKQFPFYDNIVIRETDYISRNDIECKPVIMEPSYISKRYHDTAHNHPELVGTLDKCKFVLNRDAGERGVLSDLNVKTVERDFFGQHLAKGIISPNQIFDIVLELKYDGISVEADCTDEIVSARSRGDTGTDKAADLTPILAGYRFPNRPHNSDSIGVKFEAIITQNDLPAFNRAKGYEYANCRSAIVGLLSSSDAYKYRDFITLVPLAVERSVFENVCYSDRILEIEYLNKYFVTKGCPLRYTVAQGDYIQNLVWTNIFTSNAEALKSSVPFMYDGIVLSYRDKNIRNILGRENFINKYSIAVKFNPLRKETIFRGYSYTVGQDGSITPMIHYDPVEFYGTIHNKSSGHSYARFIELDLHLGDIISVEYVNDVMPYVSKPFCDYNIDNDAIVPSEVFPNICPCCGSIIDISNTERSARCVNPNCNGRQLARMISTCSKLGIDGFGEATLSKIGLYHISELFGMLNGPEPGYYLSELGFGPVEITNIIAEVDKVLTSPLQEEVLLGSIGFTNISIKTWELILDKVDFEQLKTLIMNDRLQATNLLLSIKGIGPMTVDTIMKEFDYFKNDIEYLLYHANVVKYSKKAGKKIRFSGFRDEEFSKYLNSIGFDSDSNGSLTQDTNILLVPNYNHNSTKTQKAQKYGIQIVDINDFKSNIQKYM